MFLIDSLAMTILVLTLFKSITIGSEFSFYWWIKDGKKYTNWYFHRETYIRHRREEEK